MATSELTIGGGENGLRVRPKGYKATHSYKRDIPAKDDFYSTLHYFHKLCSFEVKYLSLSILYSASIPLFGNRLNKIFNVIDYYCYPPSGRGG